MHKEELHSTCTMDDYLTDYKLPLGCSHSSLASERAVIIVDLTVSAPACKSLVVVGSALRARCAEL